MFSRPRSFPLLFRVVEKEPPRINNKRSSQNQRIRRPTTTATTSSSSSSSSSQNFNSHRKPTQSNNEEDFAQNRFASRNWKDIGKFNTQQQHQNSSMVNNNKPEQHQFESPFLSRVEALKVKMADDLRNKNNKGGNFASSSVINKGGGSLPLGAKEIRPKHYQELAQESFDPLDRARTKSERREALKKMKILAMEQKERDLEDNMDYSHITVAEGKSTNPVLKEINDTRKNQTAIASESALAQSTIFRNKLSSRRNMSSWDLIGGNNNNLRDQQQFLKDQYGNNNNNNTKYQEDDDEHFGKDLFGSKLGNNYNNNTSTTANGNFSLEEEVAMNSSSREWEKSEGHYKHTFDESTNLEHHRDSLQFSKSIYTKRDLPLPGLFSYQNFTTALEEKQIAAELTKLLLRPSAAFHANEGRYCINLYEKKLHIRASSHQNNQSNNSKNNNTDENLLDDKESPTAPRDPLAFSLHEDSPVLKSVLERAARVGVIPSMPNVVQVSEMVTPYSGYSPHLKHNSIGSYCGILNLISRAQMTFAHIDQPWSPKVLMVPRSLYVMSHDLLKQFKVGYDKLDHELKYHETSHSVARFTKDYRLEIMFATVDAEEVPRLAVPVRASEKLEEMMKAKNNGTKKDSW